MGELQGKKYNPEAAKAAKDLEPPTKFQQRILSWWDETILQSPEDAVILAVGHGAFIGKLLSELATTRGYTFEYQQIDPSKKGPVIATWQTLNASIQVVEVRSDGTGNIIRWNDVSHLRRIDVVGNADALASKTVSSDQ